MSAEPHCVICAEIEAGLQKERENNLVSRCEHCGKRGYIPLGDGTAVACNTCARGYRLKLWLRHEQLAGRTFADLKIKIAA